MTARTHAPGPWCGSACGGCSIRDPHRVPLDCRDLYHPIPASQPPPSDLPAPRPAPPTNAPTHCPPMRTRCPPSRSSRRPPRPAPTLSRTRRLPSLSEWYRSLKSWSAPCAEWYRDSTDRSAPCALVESVFRGVVSSLRSGGALVRPRGEVVRPRGIAFPHRGQQAARTRQNGAQRGIAPAQSGHVGPHSLHFRAHSLHFRPQSLQLAAHDLIGGPQPPDRHEHLADCSASGIPPCRSPGGGVSTPALRVGSCWALDARSGAPEARRYDGRRASGGRGRSAAPPSLQRRAWPSRGFSRGSNSARSLPPPIFRSPAPGLRAGLLLALDPRSGAPVARRYDGLRASGRHGRAVGPRGFSDAPGRSLTAFGTGPRPQPRALRRIPPDADKIPPPLRGVRDDSDVRLTAGDNPAGCARGLLSAPRRSGWPTGTRSRARPGPGPGSC